MLPANTVQQRQVRLLPEKGRQVTGKRDEITGNFLRFGSSTYDGNPLSERLQRKRVSAGNAVASPRRIADRAKKASV